MDYDNSIQVQLDTFQFNAGIVGFIYAMEFAGKEKGVDYDYDRHTLYISRELLENSEEMANIYCDAMVEKYSKSSVVNKILTADYDNLPMSELKKFDLWCNRKTTNNVCGLLGNNDVSENIGLYVKSKDEDSKRHVGKQLVSQILNNEELKRHLYLSDIALFKMSIFFNNLAFLKKGQGYSVYYGQNFATQIHNKLFKNVLPNKKDGDYYCINCEKKISDETKIEMSFLRGSVADMSKKSSIFWNRKADTYVCPICFMIYAFMPLGFLEIGNGLMTFVNVDDSVEQMYKLNQIAVKDENEELYSQTYNIIFSKLIDLNLKYVNTMQVISKDKDNRYSISNISKDKLSLIKAGQQEMKYMPGWKIGDNFINVYREVLDNVINLRNQYTLIARLVRAEYNNSSVLFNILKMQIRKNNINEEGKMEKKFNVAYSAKMCGNELRNVFGSEADNKVRGFCYQLLNAVQANNIELFSDRIIRMYVGMQKPIPEIFINGFKGEEEFKTIGYAYIIGLKGENRNNINEGDKGNE